MVGPHCANAKLLCVTDNMQVIAMVNTGCSANQLCMSWLHEIFWMCFVGNISASYIRSVDNTLADALSCLPYSGVPLKCLNILQDTNMLFAFSQN